MYSVIWNMSGDQLNVFTALIKVLDKELLTTLLFLKCKTLAFISLIINCLFRWGPKIDGQHDVDDLCRNNYLINVKLLFAYIFAHHLKYWILQLFWFAKYNVHICSNGGLYHTVKVGIWYILNNSKHNATLFKSSKW